MKITLILFDVLFAFVVLIILQSNTSLFEIDAAIYWWHLLIDVKPDPNFLSELATFESVIIGIAIPMSVNIITIVSERYKSEVLTKLILYDWRSIALNATIVVGISFAVVLEFFNSALIDSIWWNIFSWTALCIFACSLTLLVIYIMYIIRYITDPHFLISKLTEKAKNALK